MTDGQSLFLEPPALLPVIPVSLLNRLARERLESAFPLCWVAGEISNLSCAPSGHVYFSLKDAGAQVRCVLFRNRAQLLGWRLENGQHVEARVLVTLYEARGDFQLNVEAARRVGAGNLYEQFLRLKARLESEGLFAVSRKRGLPAFPRRIGIVTSPQAAALRDVLSTLTRRAPQVRVVVYPTPVQGDGAARQIADAIRCAGERLECDVLIVCRGGGSAEDLWAFNEEVVARAIGACPLPVISGVGHETDVTIADFVADHRAPTPTAAAELAAPERRALLARLAAAQRALQRQMERLVQQRVQQLDGLAQRLQRPAQYVARHRDNLLALARRLAAALRQNHSRAGATLALHHGHWLLLRPDIAGRRSRLATLAERLRHAEQRLLQLRTANLARLHDGLTHLDPRAVLARGYAIVADTRGQIVRDSSELEPSQQIAVLFHRGRAQAAVLSVCPDQGLPLVAANVASAPTPE